MVLNPDPTKQAHEVTFSRKSRFPKNSDLYFNGLLLEKGKTQRYLRNQTRRKTECQGTFERKFYCC